MQAPGPEIVVWSERLRIHSYEVDFKHLARAESLFRLFLEGAWSHAEQLGVGFHQLAAEGRYWVLSRLAIEFEQYPRWGEEVILTTWPRGVTSVFALREFEIAAATGGRMVAGSSAWLVLDARTRRPQRLKSIVKSIPGLPQKAALKQDPEKLAAIQNSLLSMTTSAQYSAVDVNSHVNSARYIGWMLDAYPLSFHRAHCLRLLELNYLSETLGGEELSVLTATEAPMRFYHSIVKSGGAEVCRARMVWAKIED